MKPEYNDASIIELAQMGMSNRAIARLFEVDEKTIRNRLKRNKYAPRRVPTDVDERFGFRLDQPITVTADKVAVTADWHIPLYDPEYVNLFLKYCEQKEVKDLVIGGDFFNFDALSQYYPKQTEAGLAGELSEGVMMMNTLLSVFDNIYYIWGNHDARLHKALGFQLQFKEAMKLLFGELDSRGLERIQFSNLDHLWVELRDGRKYYVCHPGSYSRIPLSIPKAISAKLNANVISAHAHHCAAGYAVDGEKVVIEVGGLFDRHKTAYLQRSTTFPTWTQGFCVLEFLQPAYLHSPGFYVGTDY
jgi:predicted phosphodiesterase